jgi:DNA (cytosine-5)-methyltransferase 1
MTDEATLDLLQEKASHAHGGRLALVGGPPCQGFSTGGNRRSVEDARNDLHKRYAELLSRLRPDVFIFENVLGLLSIDGKRFLPRIIDGFHTVGYDVALWRLNAARFGVPQRRERLVLVGVPAGASTPVAPQPWTSPVVSEELFALPPVCGTIDAIGDLPILGQGEDGSALSYRASPDSEYQQLMRGHLSPAEYVAGRHADYAARERSGTLRGGLDSAATIYAR